MKETGVSGMGTTAEQEGNNAICSNITARFVRLLSYIQ
jgi:hypothetical protein